MPSNPFLFKPRRAERGRGAAQRPRPVRRASVLTPDPGSGYAAEAMFACPNCGVGMARVHGPAGIHWQCGKCSGRAATIAYLRNHAPIEYARDLWRRARDGLGIPSRACPSCAHRMREICLGQNDDCLRLDVCSVCHFLWFDPSEFERVPALRPPDPAPVMPARAREALAMFEVEHIRRQAEQDREGVFVGAPDSWWQVILGVFGVPVESDAPELERRPWATWTVAAACLLVSLLAFTDLKSAIDRFGFLPADPFRMGGLTLISSFFLHGGLAHLLGNLYFLLVFGDNVEDYLGKGPYLGLLALAALAGSIVHAVFDPRSGIPCVGASGGISGVVVFYALAFPQARLGFLMRFFLMFRWISMPAWFALILWLIIQSLGVWAQVGGFGHVSALAHLGGAAIGFVFWIAGRIAAGDPHD